MFADNFLINCVICFRGIFPNKWKECYSEGRIDGDRTLLNVRYGRPNDCRPCTSPPDLAGKTIDELTASDLLCDAGKCCSKLIIKENCYFWGTDVIYGFRGMRLPSSFLNFVIYLRKFSIN